MSDQESNLNQIQGTFVWYAMMATVALLVAGAVGWIANTAVSRKQNEEVELLKIQRIEIQAIQKVCNSIDKRLGLIETNLFTK